MKCNLTEEKLAAFLEGRLSSYECGVISNLIDSDETLSSLISDIKEIEVLPKVSIDDQLSLNENIELPNIDSIVVEDSICANFSLHTYELDPTLLFPVLEVNENVELGSHSNDDQVNLRLDEFEAGNSLFDTDSLIPFDDSIEINSQDF